MNPTDGMVRVYRDMVLWEDVVILATPIRWENTSSLFNKMAERLNTVQNQITLNDKVLIKNKVASFIISGGQENIQSVAGQLNTFFTDLSFIFPPFNFVGWSRGWTFEDMENNVIQLKWPSLVNGKDGESTLPEQGFPLTQMSVSNIVLEQLDFLF